MLNFIQSLFGLRPATNFKSLVTEGALIIDVRSVTEFQGGHIQNAINLPVGDLQQNLDQFKDKNQVIITCCASGIRSAAAKNILKSNGYTRVYNGGGWNSLSSKL